MFISRKKFEELERRANLAKEWEGHAFALDRELERLRTYVKEDMKWHFSMYNGGLYGQIKMLHALDLPTPWVPMDLSYSPDSFSNIRTITYVREHRMVPLAQAGRI